MKLISRALALGITASFLLLPGCSVDKNAPTAPPASATPPDPNAGLYGSWQGALNMTSPSGRAQDAIRFYVTSGAIAFWVNFTQYPVTGYTLADPNKPPWGVADPYGNSLRRDPGGHCQHAGAVRDRHLGGNQDRRRPVGGRSRREAERSSEAVNAAQPALGTRRGGPATLTRGRGGGGRVARTHAFSMSR